MKKITKIVLTVELDETAAAFLWANRNATPKKFGFYPLNKAVEDQLNESAKEYADVVPASAATALARFREAHPNL